GRYRSKTASSPPTHTARRPDRAPAGPPLTGASSTATSWPASASCTWRTTVGEFVDRSKYADPGRNPSTRPPAPSATSATSAGPGSDVKTTSLAAATAAGPSAQVAPA